MTARSYKSSEPKDYQQWLRRTQASCRHATRRIAQLEKGLAKLTIETNVFLKQYGLERQRAGLG
ncbi:MAG: hypothetical protein Q8L27_01590 [archaeon]|nr:hypothetical protein [archaeon]